ncbi:MULTISPECIES: hypothetical protein [Paraburkholderia]|uniref:hypothetical protein n=1 Tax=Paraburkholderia TaxID=1822464 RepID=UPI002259C93D|nr:MULTISPECIES: hypothetical protein [Paraburkholderia]
MSRSTSIASSRNWMNKDSFSSVPPVTTATSWWIQVQTRPGARSLSRATTGSRVKISLTEDNAAEHLPRGNALEARRVAVADDPARKLAGEPEKEAAHNSEIPLAE